MAPHRLLRPAMSETKGAEELAVVINLNDFHKLAKEKMDVVDYDYYVNGAEDEVTLHRNYSAWHKYVIWPRFLGPFDMGDIPLDRRLMLPVRPLSGDVFTELLLKMPMMVAPMAMQKLAHPEGEVGLARAAKDAGVLYCITQQATTKIESICEGSLGGAKFFQMYMFKDKALCLKLIKRCESCQDIKALVITVDSPVLGRRERDLRNKFNPSSRGVKIVNWTESADEKKEGATSEASSKGPVVAHATVASRIGGRDAGLNWKDIEWVQQNTKLPVILKGVMHPWDALKAEQAGCSAVWISNHGGRQLDGGVGTADSLPHVVKALERKQKSSSGETLSTQIPIIVDGGITRGTDVLKALLLGAAVVCVGRPLLWALAVGGEKGAALGLSILHDELKSCMALSGVPSADQATLGFGRENRLLAVRGEEDFSLSSKL